MVDVRITLSELWIAVMLTYLLGDVLRWFAGKGCIYIKRLSDVDPSVLEEVVASSYADTRRTYG